MNVVFSSLIAGLVLLLGAAPETPEPAATPTNANVGVIIRISPVSTGAPLGAPMLVSEQIQNVGDVPLLLTAPSFGGAKRFRVTNATTGDVVEQQIRADVSVLNHAQSLPVPLPVGSQWKDVLDVSHFVRFTTAGTYRVQLVIPDVARKSDGRPIRVSSNYVTMTITQ